MENLVLFWASIVIQIIENKCVGIFEREQQESRKTLCDKCFSSLEFLINLMAWGTLGFLACDMNSKCAVFFVSNLLPFLQCPRGSCKLTTPRSNKIVVT